ncbi:choline/ethanolamine transporter FLVCR1-like [Clavelina lepadiformis]|uniref:choline/ethanolamine transporter FLVCR1-like n=1 Tax=Clavelina lepadiformis TaxID=159417 RepID=UPI00404386B8
MLAVLQTINSFNFSGFGQASSVYQAYFHVPYPAIDWLTLSSFAGVCLFSPLLAWLSYADITRLRKLIITAATLMCFAYLCTVISVAVEKHFVFPVMVFGQLCNGITASILVSTPAVFADIWFPDHEIGTAIGGNLFGISAGLLLGFLLPVNILATPPFGSIRPVIYSKNHSNTSAAWYEEDHFSLTVMYAVFLVISMSTLVLVVTFFVDEPLLPPSQAQLVKRQNERSKKEDPTITTFFKQTTMLFNDRIFVLSALVLGVVFHINSLEFTMLNEIIANILNRNNQATEYSNHTSGYIMSLFSVGGLFGSFVAGKIMDNYKRYEVQARIGIFVVLFSNFGLLFALFFRYIIGFYICNAIFGFSARISMTALFEILTLQAYSMKESFVSAWGTCIQAGLGIIFAELGRVFYIYTGGIGVLAFQCFVVFLAFIASCLIKPTYPELLT